MVCVRCRIAAPTLRRLATHIVVPEYPKEDITAKMTGIAVAELCVPAGATIASPVRIVSAPSAAIADSMRKALAQWRFKPITSMPNSTDYVSYASKVIYYFVEQNGQFVVLSPAESFYVGPRFALRQQADASR
jgi:hypothetical protein